MLNLIKYEFRKSWFVKGIILAITAIFEVIFLIGMASDNEDMLGFGVSFLALTAVCALFLIGVLGIITLHKDLNTKQSYMLFMTPNNSYKILGSKMIENAISIFIAGLFYIALAIADITAWAAKSDELKGVIELINYLLGEDYAIDAPSFALSSMSFIVGWIYVITIGFFAVVISATLLNGRKFNGLISFIIFLAIVIISGIISDSLLEAIVGYSWGYSTEQIIFNFVYNICLSVGFYAISAWLMDNKLSV